MVPTPIYIFRNFVLKVKHVPMRRWLAYLPIAGKAELSDQVREMVPKRLHHHPILTITTWETDSDLDIEHRQKVAYQIRWRPHSWFHAMAPRAHLHSHQFTTSITLSSFTFGILNTMQYSSKLIIISTQLFQPVLYNSLDILYQWACIKVDLKVVRLIITDYTIHRGFYII